jgi:hypothetical protein
MTIRDHITDCSVSTGLSYPRCAPHLHDPSFVLKLNPKLQRDVMHTYTCVHTCYLCMYIRSP